MRHHLLPHVAGRAAAPAAAAPGVELVRGGGRPYKEGAELGTGTTQEPTLCPTPPCSRHLFTPFSSQVGGGDGGGIGVVGGGGIRDGGAKPPAEAPISI